MKNRNEYLSIYKAMILNKYRKILGAGSNKILNECYCLHRLLCIMHRMFLVYNYKNKTLFYDGFHLREEKGMCK